MSASTSWGILASLPPVTAVAAGALWYERARWFEHCKYRVPPWLGSVTVAWCVLLLITLAALLTIATEAARRPQHGPLQRFAWVLALFCASPLTAPFYWVMYLRGPR
ncbi:MAG TPA: hypothetical protein VER11_26180 [Polyangiaceae bacterium]|nr:hypothetical protein [Polyangiaceae bacterium]